MRLADEPQPVADGGRDDDRGAVLVVMEDRDLHPLAQLGLDHEAFRRLDVLEIDGAEGRLERGDDVDQLVGIVLVDLDVEDVDAGEFLEQDRLAFHHRLGGERADAPSPSTAVPLVMTATRLPRAVRFEASPGRRRWPRRRRRRPANRPAPGRAGWPAAWSRRSRSCPASEGGDIRARSRSRLRHSSPGRGFVAANATQPHAGAARSMRIGQEGWCGREDSNFHGVSPTATSTLRVYQFRHDRGTAATAAGAPPVARLISKSTGA